MSKAMIAALVLCISFGVVYAYQSHTIAQLRKDCQYQTERAQKAEDALAIAKTEQKNLLSALEMQEKATLDAQQSKKVIYRTIQKEVAKDETARDWYSAPVPASLVRLLKDGSSHD